MKKPKPIDVSQIDLKKMKEKTADLPGLLEYAHSIGGFAIVPTKQGVIKGNAMQAMKEQTEMHMDQIYEQMQVLANQANKLKRRAEVSFDIYESEMRFKPDVGKVYYLYQKSGKKILSLVGPAEWGSSMPFEKYIATIKLLADHTWEVLEDNQAE